MFEWLWKGVAGLAGIVALWFGLDAARTKQRMERDRIAREEAQKKMIDDSWVRIEAIRRQNAGKAPIDPKKRKDLE